MAVTTREQIANRIMAILTAIPEATIKVKYAYLESDPSGFPAALLRYAGDEIEKLDTAKNMVTYRFDVVLVFPNDESAAAQLKWLQTYDAVVSALNTEANQILSGDAVDFMVKTNLEPSFTGEYTERVGVMVIRTSTKVVQSI